MRSRQLPPQCSVRLDTLLGVGDLTSGLHDFIVCTSPNGANFEESENAICKEGKRRNSDAKPIKTFNSLISTDHDSTWECSLGCGLSFLFRKGSRKPTGLGS